MKVSQWWALISFIVSKYSGQLNILKCGRGVGPQRISHDGFDSTLFFSSFLNICTAPLFLKETGRWKPNCIETARMRISWIRQVLRAAVFFFQVEKEVFFIVEIEHIFERLLLDSLERLNFLLFFFWGGWMKIVWIWSAKKWSRQNILHTYILKVNHHYKHGGSFWSMMKPY